MLGIENLKKLVKAGLNLGEKVASSLKDKKISFFEAIGLVPEVFTAIGVVKTWAEVKAEVADLTPEETLELEQYVVAEFDIPNEKVKLFIAKALKNVVSLIELVDEFKHIDDPLPEPPTE